MDCIGPTPADPCWPRMGMLCIDPDRCLDCGVCVERRPVGAIFAEQDLPPEQRVYTLINAAYFLWTTAKW
jgi:ferredoxin--NADP+ reductase